MIDLSTFSESSIRQAMRTLSDGYATPEHTHARIRAAGRETPVYRFDLGQNCDGPAPGVLDHFKSLVDSERLSPLCSHYPESGRRRLRQRLAELHSVQARQVLLAAGAEQVIGLLARSLLTAGDSVLVFRPSFYVFEAFSQRVGARVRTVELSEGDGFALTERTLARLHEVIRVHRPRIVWMADPNNPTGRAVGADLLQELAAQCEQHNCLLVVDEAYGEYTDPDDGIHSASGWLDRFAKLFVIRTFSKARGLAGMRIGYGLGSDPALIRQIEAHGYNYPVGQLAVDLAHKSLDDPDHLRQTRRRLKERQRDFFQKIQPLKQIKTLTSDSPLVLLRHLHMEAGELAGWLERRGIFVARIPGPARIHDRFLRLTLNTVQSNQVLIDHLATLASTLCGSATDPGDPQESFEASR